MLLHLRYARKSRLIKSLIALGVIGIIGMAGFAAMEIRERVYISQTKKIILTILELINKNYSQNIRPRNSQIIAELISFGMPTPYGIISIVDREYSQAVNLPWGRFLLKGDCDTIGEPDGRCSLKVQSVLRDASITGTYDVAENNKLNYVLTIRVNLPPKSCSRLRDELPALLNWNISPSKGYCSSIILRALKL